MPTITVITPAYNAEKTIAQTIESVLNQTYSDFEFLIINDGSSDRTLEVIKQFQDPRLQVFSYANAGYAITQNRGITKASGDYISFLDADDVWQPQKLAAQWQALQDYPAASVAYSWSDFVDENGKFLHQGGCFRAKGNVYAQLLVKNFIENGSNLLIRRSVFTEVGGFDETMVNCADWEMWLRIAKDHEFVCVPEAQVLYRVSTQSESSKLTQVEAMCRKIIQENFAKAPLSLQSLKRESLANIYLYLTFRSLDTVASLPDNLRTIRYLFLAVTHDYSLLKRRSRLVSIMILKLLAQSILGTKLTRQLTQR